MMVTEVPPLVDPDVGATEVTPGWGSEGEAVCCGAATGRGDLYRHVDLLLGLRMRFGDRRDLGGGHDREARCRCRPELDGGGPDEPSPGDQLYHPLVVPEVGVNELIVGTGATSMHRHAHPAVVTFTMAVPAT